MPASGQGTLCPSLRAGTILGSLPLPVAGVDEAGRGCLAGPVVAAAVILPPDFHLPGLGDSKALSKDLRHTLQAAIKNQAVAFAVSCSWPRVIERVNILQATLLAMARAVSRLTPAPASLAVDGNQNVPLDLPQKAIVDGDALVPAISAASILAKTFRDRLMERLERKYPGYGFARHKGYGTKAHMAAIRELGPCVAHRMTFRGVAPDKNTEQHSLWPNT